MTTVENSRQGLEQLHQLISGLLISSAHAGELVKQAVSNQLKSQARFDTFGSEEKSLRVFLNIKQIIRLIFALMSISI